MVVLQVVFDCLIFFCDFDCLITPRGPVCTAEPAGAASPPPAAAACTPDAAGRARCYSGEGRCADPFNVHCTKSLYAEVRLAQAGFGGFRHGFGANEDARSSHSCVPEQGGMYPTFDSAAGSGEIPVFFGILPYLILRVTVHGLIPLRDRYRYINITHWLTSFNY